MSRTHLVRHAVLAALLSTFALACAPDDTVVVTRDTRFLSDTASPVSRPFVGQPIVSVRAIGGSATSPVTYEGTVGADGSFTFVGVTSLPIYVLVTYAPSDLFVDAPGTVFGFPVAARRVRLGNTHLGRPDVPQTTMDTTRLALHVTGGTPWTDSSLLGFFSRSADVWAYASPGSDAAETAAPIDGATSIDGWTFGVETMSLPYGGTLPLFDTALGDDVVVYRWDSTRLSTSPSPWDEAALTSVTQFGSVASATLTDGATTSLTTTLAASGTSAFAIDYRGSEFTAIREMLGVSDTVATSVYIALVHEGGSGPDYFNAVTPPVFELGVSSAFVPDDPTCFPDDAGACDPTVCPTGCNDATHRVEPGDFTSSVDTLAPFGVGRDVIAASATWYEPWLDSGGTNRAIDRSVAVYRPATSGAPIGVIVSPPLHIRVDGTEMAIAPGSASIASATPTITWDPPSQGTARYYHVDLVAQRSFTSTAGGMVRRRVVGSFFTLEPTFTVPAGVLVAGADYFARVTASVATWREANIGQPGGTDASSAYNASGVFHY